MSESFPDDEHDRPGLGRHHRSSTLTSLGGFEFQPLPLTLSGEEDGVKAQGEEKHLSLLHGAALIIGTQVGSGIFSSPGVVVAEVGSPGASLCVWIMSATLAWTGASSFAELGCAIPLSGGAQAYLAYAYGPMVSFLYTWTGVSVIKPGGAAIIALIFGEYVNRMIYHAATTDAEAPEWTFKITAIFVVGVVTVLNLASKSMGTNSTVVITTVKMMSLLFVGVLGVVWLVKNGPGEALSRDVFKGSSTSPGNYAIALYSGLWAFDGWDAACVSPISSGNINRGYGLRLLSCEAATACHDCPLIPVRSGRNEGYPTRPPPRSTFLDDHRPPSLCRRQRLLLYRVRPESRRFDEYRCAGFRTGDARQVWSARLQLSRLHQLFRRAQRELLHL